MSVSSAIDQADSTWTLACALLGFWVSHGSGTSARNGNSNSDYQRWRQAEASLRGEFIARVGGDGRVSQELKSIIVTETADGADLHAVHAAGWALSLACSATFASTWRLELGEREQVCLRTGDLFPCCDAPWPWLADGRRSPTSRGSSLTNPPDDELPHVRRLRPLTIDTRDVQVVVDFGFEAQLISVLDRVELAVGVHPNQRIEEFEMPGNPSFFPIAPADRDGQADAALSGLERAVEAGASIVILPELSVEESLLEQLAAEVDDLDDEVLLVAGSRHHLDGDVAVNDATAVLAGHPRRMTHRKAVRFTTELGGGPGTREGIDRVSPVRLNVYQAGPYRLALPICKDLLDASMADALAHVGANVLLVPSMSPKTDAFLGRALELLAANQALTVMVCGPLNWGSQAPDPVALRVQPAAGATQTSRARAPGQLTRLPIG